MSTFRGYSRAFSTSILVIYFALERFFQIISLIIKQLLGRSLDSFHIIQAEIIIHYMMRKIGND